MEHNDLLDDKDEDKIIWEIVQWWEKKRLQYNFIVGIVGILSVSWVLSHIRSSFDEYIALYIAFVYGIIANIAYLLGWVIEILLKYYFNITAGKEFRIVLYWLGVFLSVLPIIAIFIAFVSTPF